MRSVSKISLLYLNFSGGCSIGYGGKIRGQFYKVRFLYLKFSWVGRSIGHGSKVRGSVLTVVFVFEFWGGEGCFRWTWSQATGSVLES